MGGDLLRPLGHAQELTTALPAPTGPTAPQGHVPMPEVALPVRSVESWPVLWIVGAHGGSGESSIAQLDPRWRASGHAWVATTNGSPLPCVLVARTNTRGLTAAQAALTQWAASGAGPSVRLLGLILIADAPGKLPAPLRDLAKVVGGGAPRVWQLPWNDGWRQGDEPAEAMRRPVKRLVSDLHSLAAEVTTAAENPLNWRNSYAAPR